MRKLNIKNANVFTVISILLLLGGIGFYLYWGTKYGVWVDTGLYALVAFLILAGVLGILLTLMEKKEEQ